MKILFIGGTGTLSTACAKACVSAGMDVHLLLRGTRNHRVPSGANVIQCDLRKEPKQAADLLKGQEWDCVADFVLYEPEHTRQDVELFKGRTKKFFFISSTSVYEKPLASPYVNEKTPTGNKFWSYAQKKAECENLFLKESAQGKFPVTIVRPCHTYAEFTCPTGFAGLGFGAVKRMREGKPIVVHGDGTSLWTLTFNEDFAAGFVPLLSVNSAAGEIFQVTSDETLTWNQIYETMAQFLKCEVKLVHAPSDWMAKFDEELGRTLLGDKAHSHIYDNAKMRKTVPAFKPKVSFKQGFEKCMNWFKEHEKDARYNRAQDELMDAIAESIQQSGPLTARS